MRRRRTSPGACAAGAASSTKCWAKRSPRSTDTPARCRRTSARSCSGRANPIAFSESVLERCGAGVRGRRCQRSAEGEGARRIARRRPRDGRARAARQSARQRRRADAARRAEVARRRREPAAGGACRDEPAGLRCHLGCRRIRHRGRCFARCCCRVLQRAAVPSTRLRRRAADASEEDRHADDGRHRVRPRAGAGLRAARSDARRGTLFLGCGVRGDRLHRRLAIDSLRHESRLARAHEVPGKRPGRVAFLRWRINRTRSFRATCSSTRDRTR